MPTKQPSWEGTILTMAMLFTVLIGAAYGLAVAFKGIAIPWLAIIILSVAVPLAIRYWRRLQQ